MQIDCFPLPIPCFYTVYAEGRSKPFAITETSAAFYLSPINPPDQQAANIDIKRAWCGCSARPCNTLGQGWGPRRHVDMKRAWCDCPARVCNTLIKGLGPKQQVNIERAWRGCPLRPCTTLGRAGGPGDAARACVIPQLKD